MVFYRKYRPQKIEELDSSDVREKLYSVLKSQSVPHAFLFTGPKGLGKTSTARIVAKAVNCEKNSKLIPIQSGQNSKLLASLKLWRSGQVKSQKLENEETKAQIEPCNKCYQCISITNGTNVDVLEIDGASNRGIDEIRDLREKIKLSPASSKKKVYIIDEVHMLTTEAFNALLKTLEEPPNHVLFILCTTEPHKVPATVSSRCFHIQFNKATSEELVSSFERIIKSEKLLADKEALSLIASLSDGSFRDGSKILEEMVLSASGNKLTKELIEQKYQIRQMTDQISQMLEILANKDVKGGLDQVSKLSEQGVEMGYFIEKLIQAVHSHFLYKAGVENSSKLKVKSLELGIEETKTLIEILSKAHGELKYAVLPQLPLELAIVEWSTKQSVLRSSLVGFSRPAGSAKAPRTLKEDEILQTLINKVKSYNHSIAGVLRGCRLISYDKDKLVIEAGFKFHKERLDDLKTKEIIRKAVKEINGRTIDVEVALKNK